MIDFKFDLPSKIIFDSKSAQSIPDLKEIEDRRCMLLCFPGFSANKLINELEEKCEFLFVPDNFEENPTETLVRELGKLVAENNINTIIAIGGGSSIDSAKGAAWFASNPEWQLVGNNPEPLENKICIIAVPTTAGTGSEVTPYAIFTGKDKFKRILNHPSLVPDRVVCDPELTLSMPLHVTAHTGVDALSHLIEAYLSKKCNGLLADIAITSIQRVIDILPRIIKNPDNLKLREEMMMASLSGGIVLAHCGTVMVHALGYCLTKKFGYQHGLSNALLLAAFVEVLADKGCERALQIMKMVNNDFSAFIRDCGIVNKIHPVDTATIEQWAQTGYDSYGRCNCIINLELTDIKKILTKSQGI